MSGNLTKKQLEELKQAFNLFDNDRNGTLTPAEVKVLVDKVGMNLSTKEIDDLVSNLDKNSDGTITFDEFVNQLGNKYFKKASNSDIEAVFNYFDKDKSGFIDKSELFEAMKMFNPSITKKQIDTICGKVDKDNSGQITKDEFLSLVEEAN